MTEQLTADHVCAGTRCAACQTLALELAAPWRRRAPTEKDGPPMIPTYQRHRCANTHTNILDFLKCGYPGARISGTGKYALITICPLIAIELHKTEEKAAEAKQARDLGQCAGKCRAEHRLAILAPNPAHNRKKDPR